MLKETLREWDEQNRQEGLQKGLREVKRTLCSPARQRFGEAAGAALSGILASVDDSAELARVGTLIIGCDTEAHSSLACGRASGRVGSGSGWAVRDQELWHAEARMDEQGEGGGFQRKRRMPVVAWSIEPESYRGWRAMYEARMNGRVEMALAQ